MEKIRALMADDEALARRRLRQFLAEAPDVEVVGECEDGRAAVALSRSAAPDLLFIDVQMPLLDGFGVIREVGAGSVPAVVFVTAFDQFALRAFEAHALDYLLKPFGRERFMQAVGRSRASPARVKRERNDVRRVLMSMPLTEIGTVGAVRLITEAGRARSRFGAGRFKRGARRKPAGVSHGRGPVIIVCANHLTRGR